MSIRQIDANMRAERSSGTLGLFGFLYLRVERTPVEWSEGRIETK